MMCSDLGPRVVICRSNSIAPDPRVEKTACALSGAGYAVSVIGWDRSGAASAHENVDGIGYHRLPIQAEYGTGLGNLSALLRWQWGLLRWLFRNRKAFDLIHACDFDTVLPALFCKLLFRKAVVYDIFDFYADHLRSTPAWIKKMIRRVDKVCIGWADALILADEARREQIAGAKPKICTLIYNTPQDVKADLEDGAHSGQYDLSLVYVGLLQVERGIFELLSVLETHPEWRLDLAGFGGDQDQIVTQADAMPNVYWHDRVPYREALALSQSADVLLATYDPANQNNRYASPNKVFEAMMLGKALIVARDTNIDRIVEKYDCGMVIDYGDVAALEKALIGLAENPERRSKMGRNARQAYETAYGWSLMEKRLIDLYARVWKTARRTSPRKIILAANTDWFLYNFRRVLAQHLRETGYDVLLVTPPGKFSSYLVEAGFDWIPWHLERKTISLWKEIRSFFHILRIYRRQKPDLVHHHTIKSVLYGSLAAQLVGVPCIVNSITGRGYVFLESDLQSRLIKKVIGPFYKLAHNFENSAVIFENGYDHHFFLKSGYISEERSWLIESIGADPRQFSPTPEPAGPPVILMAGRMLWSKGVGVFVEAARILKANHDARFVLVGEPDPGNPASIGEAQLQQWNQSGLIEWWGWQADMASVYARSHAVVLPTMYGEGVPTTLVEGAACGRPLVGTDTPGCRPVIRPEINGLLVPPDDPQALAAAFERLINDPDLRQEMGRKGRQIFMQKFTYDRINREMMEIYTSLLKNREID